MPKLKNSQAATAAVEYKDNATKGIDNLVSIPFCFKLYKESYVDGGKAVIECSSCKYIALHSDMHPDRILVDEDGNLTRAEFDIENFWAGPYDYVRMSVIDKDGKKAWTNPIFLENK